MDRREDNDILGPADAPKTTAELAELSDTTEVFKAMLRKAGCLIEQLLSKVVNQGSNKTNFKSTLEGAPEVLEILQKVVETVKTYSPQVTQCCAADVAVTFPKILEMFYHFSSWLFMSE